MATPPTSNCDDVSQDSSGAFSFNQNINSSTNTSISKAANESRHRNGCSTNYKGSISKSIFVNAQFLVLSSLMDFELIINIFLNF